MVATTFAADTPLAVAELVADGGIAKNWLWWSFIFGGALTTFFFAMLWHRANILTELEFISIRYEGRPAFYLRLFKSVYLGLFINSVIIAWVNLAMMSLIEVFFEVTRNTAFQITLGLMVLAVIYSTLSGLKGVAVTDTFQFIIAMIGCVILAILVVTSEEVGGIDNLKSNLPKGALDFIPSVNSGESAIHGFGLSIGAFFSFVAIQWWASWYPGAEPGGGGYIAQRMMSTKTEKDAIWATLLFQVGHYCIRPWPWIIVGLCAVVLYTPKNEELKSRLAYFSLPQHTTVMKPEVMQEDILKKGASNAAEYLSLFPSDVAHEKSIVYHYEPRLGFVFAMRDFLPAGLVGLLLVAFIAAYLSTISTQVNWGASYIVNDFINPLAKSMSSEKLVLYSRLTSVLVMLGGAIITPFVTSISGVWEFILQCGAGLGLVLILRWYWWRINAWSEIAATIAPLFAFGFCEFYLNDALGVPFTSQNGSYYVTVGFTTIIWLSVTFATKPPSKTLIEKFDRRVRPMGIWPAYISDMKVRNGQIKWLLLNMLAMILFIISLLFSIGSILLMQTTASIIYLMLSIISVMALNRFLKKTNIFERNSETL